MRIDLQNVSWVKNENKLAVLIVFGLEFVSLHLYISMKK